MAGRIDTATVQRIIDAADIVDVVSDYVRLKRRGSGYIGLCPFHNERTPSFSVSKSKGLCKCFSCGKGGSPIGFIMEIEQVSYPEALRLLAKKYNIEIEEHELTAEEKERENTRESLMAVNEFALKRFEANLTESAEGKSVGYAYFRERGLDDRIIKKFRLGYSLEKRDGLYQEAVTAGFKEQYLEETGLCVKSENGGWRDRFRGRVIYPIFTVSGKVVGFGGRTLRKDKDVAKYVNSPESTIYKKSYELYGLYQAKSSIVKLDKCILVEGYMDVISMHQAGVENVVASSGTSLTEGQIRLIHRFTDNVTVIYDSDPAGIKASLRGIDMLLAEGMKIKVLLLPDGEDPDSFAQGHSSTEVTDYIRENESDFIAFKTRILLDGVKNDPIARTKVITDIVRSISVIPDQIMRTVYIGECSRSLAIDEKVLALQVAKFIAEKAEKDSNDAQREKMRREAGLPEQNEGVETIPAQQPAQPVKTADANSAFLAPYERELLRYVVRYGMMYLGDTVGEDETEVITFNVLDYIRNEMAQDGVEFTTPEYALVFNEINEYVSLHWATDYNLFTEKSEISRKQRLDEGISRIKAEAVDLADIQRKEKDLNERVDNECNAEKEEFTALYIARALASSSNSIIRQIVLELAEEKHQLSKIHTKYSKVETERDRLRDLVPMAYYNLSEAIIELRIKNIVAEMKQACSEMPRNDERIVELMRSHAELNEMKKEFARYLGERIIAPRIRH